MSHANICCKSCFAVLAKKNHGGTIRVMDGVSVRIRPDRSIMVTCRCGERKTIVMRPRRDLSLSEEMPQVSQ